MASFKGTLATYAIEEGTQVRPLTSNEMATITNVVGQIVDLLLNVIESIEEISPYFPQHTDYGGFYSGAFAYDLGSLDHLKQYGVDVYRPYRPHFGKWLEGK